MLPDENLPMNAVAHAERQALQLVDIIDFKWMLASDGLYVHVERLQNDPAYLAECLALAAASPRAAVRAAAARLQALARQAPTAD